MQGDNGQGYVCRSGTLRCFYMNRTIYGLVYLHVQVITAVVYSCYGIFPPTYAIRPQTAGCGFLFCNTIGGMEYDPNKSEELT